MASSGELRSVYRLKDGRWAGYIITDIKADGTDKRKHRYGRTKQIVKEKLDAIDHLAFIHIGSDKAQTLKDWLVYFCSLKGGKPKTRASRKYDADKVIKYYGDVYLKDFKRKEVQELFKQLREEGLQLSTQSHIYHFLKSALNEAVEHDLIAKNPSLRLKLEGESRNISKAWESDEVIKFLDTAQNDRFYALYYLMLTQGLRSGEAFALNWSNLISDRQLLIVEKTLSIVDHDLKPRPTLVSAKTERSVREIPIAKDALDVLLRHKTLQLLEKAKQPKWKDQGLIFPSSFGTPMHSGNFIRRHFKPLVHKAGLRYIRPHDLRHTHITLARDAGVDVEVVAHRVGQDSRVTLRTYSKVTKARQRKGAKTLSELTSNTVDNTKEVK